MRFPLFFHNETVNCCSFSLLLTVCPVGWKYFLTVECMQVVHVCIVLACGLRFSSLSLWRYPFSFNIWFSSCLVFALCNMWQIAFYLESCLYYFEMKFNLVHGRLLEQIKVNYLLELYGYERGVWQREQKNGSWSRLYTKQPRSMNCILHLVYLR
jgi:hypothetical protein